MSIAASTDSSSLNNRLLLHETDLIPLRIGDARHRRSTRHMIRPAQHAGRPDPPGLLIDALMSALPARNQRDAAAHRPAAGVRRSGSGPPTPAPMFTSRRDRPRRHLPLEHRRVERAQPMASVPGLPKHGSGRGHVAISHSPVSASRRTHTSAETTSSRSTLSHFARRLLQSAAARRATHRAGLRQTDLLPAGP